MLPHAADCIFDPTIAQFLVTNSFDLLQELPLLRDYPLHDGFEVLLRRSSIASLRTPYWSYTSQFRAS